MHGVKNYRSGCLIPAQQTWLTGGNIKMLRTWLGKTFRQFDKDVMNQLLIPIVDSFHFFVLVVDFNPTSPYFLSRLHSTMIPRDGRQEGPEE